MKSPVRTTAVLGIWLLSLTLCWGFLFAAIRVATNLRDGSSALVGIAVGGATMQPSQALVWLRPVGGGGR